MAQEENATMQELMERFTQRVPEESPHTFSGQMEPRLVSCDEKAKCVVFAFHTEDWMRNPGGAVHGGVIAEAISMTINALAWYYAGQKQNPAVSIQLSYPRPAVIGKDIFVRATAIHAGKSMAYVGAIAWQDDKEDKPFATGTSVHYTAAAIEDEEFE